MDPTVLLALVLCGGQAGPATAEPDVAPPSVTEVAPPPDVRGRLPGVRLQWTSTREGWIEVSPLVSGSEARFFSLSGGPRSMELSGFSTGPAMLCFGGEGLATRCERHLLTEHEAVPLAGPRVGVEVKGRVLVGRSPAGGARIAVVPHPLAARVRFSMPLLRREGKLVREVTTDREGRFSLPPLAPGDYRLDILRPGGRIEQGEPFSVPEPDELRRQGSPARPVFDLGDIVLEPGLQLEVSVVDSAGQPIAGAAVGLMQEREQDFPVFFEAKSDPQGKVILSGLDGSLPTALSCQARGRVRSEQRLDPLPGAATCVLLGFSALAGVVVDEADEAVAGATIAVRGADRTVRTDAEGRFAVSELREGEHALVVAAPGFRAIERTITLAAEERRLLPPLRLQPARPLAGTVVDGLRDEPIAGAVLTVVDPAGAGGAVTDEEGEFLLAADAEGALKIETRSAGYPPATTEVGEAWNREEPLRIELLPGGRVHVAVWDEEADAPCAGCSVSLMLPGAGGEGLLTGADGEALSPPLSPGTYHVTLVKTQSLGSVVHVQGGHDVRFAEVEPGRVAHVRFGARRATVEVVLSPPPLPGWSLRASGALGAEIVPPGPRGTFVVRKRAGDPVVLNLVGSSGTEVRQAVLAADLDDPVVQLPLPQTSVHGVVVEGEAPLAQRPLQLMSAGGVAAGSTGTDPGGGFLVPHLPPGLYHLLLDGRVLRSFELAPEERLDLGTVAAPAAAPDEPGG